MRRIALCLACAAVLAPAAHPATAPLHTASIRVADDSGVALAPRHSPKRIVSLLPSLTETVCALGACDRLVGVDRYSNHPARVRELPKVGGGIDPDLERVVALKPDLVLVAPSSRVATRLESLGLEVLALEPRTSEDFERALRTIATALDSDRADSLLREIETGVAAAALALPAHAKGAHVYFEVNNGPYAAGPQSFVGEIMSRLGLVNIIPPGLGPYPKLNPEFVVRANPDVILIGQRNAQGLADRPGWSGIRAIAERRVCTFDEEEADVLVRAGPRMAEAARLIVDCLARTAPGPARNGPSGEAARAAPAFGPAGP
ncbi:MAG: helical backbone metal receptor [Burkholderiales bacterium]